MSREIYRSTVGEHVVWKAQCTEEDTEEDREGKAKGADTAIYIQIYGESGKSRQSRQSTRQGLRTEETQETKETDVSRPNRKDGT